MRWILPCLHPGLIVHRGTPNFGSRFVCKMLGSKDSHDGGIVKLPGGGLGVGDSEPWRSHTTPIIEYMHTAIQEHWRLTIYKVAGSTLNEDRAAAKWWMENVNGKRYDFRGPFFLWLKAMGMWSGSVRQWDWAYWCEEGWKDAYVHALNGRNPWLKDYPSPITTEKRAREGLFIDVTKEVILP